MAVPLPFRTPVTDVPMVIDGVVVALATVPFRPLAVATETLVTVPLPPPPPPPPDVALSAIYKPSPGVTSKAPAASA